MRHRVDGRKLGRTSSHRKAMFRNLVTSLILNDRVETTLPKAKELRRWADSMVTIAKKNTLHARRHAAAILKDRSALQKLFSTLVERYKDRSGGYTRIMKLGLRHGDNAHMAVIEYLTAEASRVVKSLKGSKETKGTKETKEVKKGKAHSVKRLASISAASKTATKKISRKETRGRKQSKKSSKGK